ncbi:testis- and ovary-specific PAZ domain protein [Rhynchospora pubera]|uniref:Testis- and ovary-specific PAZ domain protein n=1 Tax=Rhynchospora pubera TaxID=906938 RepID=A0AAV8GT32_9POAL|nr:testis- and ovary-specific PAZ domain protein [Rhynchospora pubera]
MRLRHREGLRECLEAEHHSLASSVVIRRAQTTKEALEDLLWVAHAIFIIYLGDCQTNLVSILLWDPRIHRRAVLLGLFGASFNVGFILYSVLSSSSRPKFHEKHELPNIETPELMGEKPEIFLKITRSLVLMGISTFCLLLYALWPIWSFLSILLLISLLMSSIAIIPYLLGAVSKAQILAF